ncbi:MAG: hypothetical protein GY865_06500 [candidate division Zixibacteria bacterium]|nr:hypothetical protein [candidate division Zixibacteria bacterium]
MCSNLIQLFFRTVIIIGIILVIHLSAYSENMDSQYSENSFPEYLSKLANRNDSGVWWAPYTIGNIHLFITYYGLIAGGQLTRPYIDPMTGIEYFRGGYPAYTSHKYLSSINLWFGAVAGRDTMVSTSGYGFEFQGDYTNGGIQRQTIEPLSKFYSEDAKSEQDMFTIYTDTLVNTEYGTPDPIDGRPHLPLGIEIKQSSYAWSFGYADDFILFDYEIKNVGHKFLRNTYIGILFAGMASNGYSGLNTDLVDGTDDDLCGFLETFPTEGKCSGEDTLNIVYVIDNDGHPSKSGKFNSHSPTGVSGIKILRTPTEAKNLTFNWWIPNYNAVDDFGPRKLGVPGVPFRDMNGVLGSPNGDKNKYYMMRNKEIDYDQMFTAQDHTIDGWLPKPQNSTDMADGDRSRCLLSFGSFNLSPGQKASFTIAYVGGENVHTAPDNFERLFNPYDPGEFYNTLDFSELARNARWADRVYDNPGYDTNGDGYRGKFRVCCIDSVIDETGTMICNKSREEYYAGDGVPDFRAATPPPPPIIKVIPEIDEYNHGILRIRWNGYRSENTPDPFTNEIDFEGYRIYLSLDSKKSNFSMVNSYDIDNYTRWFWDKEYNEWLVSEPPFSLDSLKAIYGNGFNPLDNQRDNPLTTIDAEGEYRACYFSMQDWNMSNLEDSLKIHKRFLNQPYPSTLIYDTAAIYYPDELTDEGEFKYFEYEYLLKNLLPSQLYYVSVTVFDYGAPGFGLSALETSPLINMKDAYPNYTASDVEKAKLRVIVYPNPYRVDGYYRERRHEGRGKEELHSDRARELHFANLPHKCTIRIFSIDGDLVREIKHDYPINHPHAAHEIWDMITRNTQAPVSGIYYYSVESEFENQIGKFVLIM